MIEKVLSVFNLDDMPDDQMLFANHKPEKQKHIFEIFKSRTSVFKISKKLDNDFETFVNLLNLNRVKYMLIGGYAVAYYGFRKNIGDIDFWIQPEKENLGKLLIVLTTFGFKEEDVPHEKLMDGLVVQLGLPPYRIDLLIGLRNLDFDSSLKRSLSINVVNTEIVLIGINDLKLSKISAGREKDIIDLNNLP